MTGFRHANRMGAGPPRVPSSKSEVDQFDNAHSTGPATQQPRSASGGLNSRPKVAVARVNPEIARETAHSKVLKLLQALALMAMFMACRGDREAGVGKTKAASKKPPLDVEVERCWKTHRSGREKVSELVRNAQTAVSVWRQNKQL